MAQNNAADDAQDARLDLDALSEGDRVTVAYDSSQSETPVEKSGEVVKTWNTGYEFVADGDDADERQIKVVRNHGVRGRDRVTSNLRPEGGETVLGNEWVHGAELGSVEESRVEDDEDEEDPELVTDGGVQVEESADDEDEEQDDADLNENPHYHPVSVSDAPGITYAVAVRETFNDGSTRTEHYTEEQARELLSGLQDALDDEDDEDPEVETDGGQDEKTLGTDAQDATTLDDLSEGDRVTVHYETTHGNDAELSGRIRSLSESTFTDQTNGAVLWNADEDRTYRLHGTRGLTVSSLRSGSPRKVGYSGTVEVAGPDPDTHRETLEQVEEGDTLRVDGEEFVVEHSGSGHGNAFETREGRVEFDYYLLHTSEGVEVGEVYLFDDGGAEFSFYQRSDLPRNVEVVEVEESHVEGDEQDEGDEDPELVTEDGEFVGSR